MSLNNLPKIVHQTWKDKSIPPALRACIESFQFMNPGWTVRFYTDEDCRAWIDVNCPQLASAYEAFPTGIHRADLFRLLVLYYDGGVYADIDVECIRPLDELLDRLDADKSVFLTRDHPAHERLHYNGRPMYMNDFMIALPQDSLIEEVIRWLLQCPPKSSFSSDAVMETGPGVISSVIEMLGGVAQIPGLQEMPTHWIHPLPDMNCPFPEALFYSRSIASRNWIKPDVFVVHYWYHTWVEGMKGKNTLTDNADLVLSTLGEQVERKLQWYLGSDISEGDAVIASAITEAADIYATVVFYVDRGTDAVMDRFLEVLALAGIRPKMLAVVQNDTEEVYARIKQLGDLGVVRVRPSLLARECRNAQTSKVLLVAASDCILDDSGLCQHVQEAGGLVLGPSVEWARSIAEGDGVTLSEISATHLAVPRIVHLLPGHQHNVPDLAEFLSEYEFSIRQWTGAEISEMLDHAFIGAWEPTLMSIEETRIIGSLAILYLHGGVAFEGSKISLPEALYRDGRAAFCHDKKDWLLACPPRSDVVTGAIQHWHSVSRKGGACDMAQFLKERVSALLGLGHTLDLYAEAIRNHPLLP